MLFFSRPKKLGQLSLALISLCLLAACSQQGPTIDYNPNTDFSQISSYQWKLETSGGDKTISPFMLERAQKAIDRELTTKNILHTSEKADVLVRYYLQQISELHEPNSRGSIGIGGGGDHVGMGVSLSLPIGKERFERELKVIIDMLEPGSERLLWRGSDSFGYDGDEEPAELNEKVAQTVNIIFSQFPPGEEQETFYCGP